LQFRGAGLHSEGDGEMVGVSLAVTGLDRVRAALRRIAENMSDLRPALDTCGTYLEAETLDNFDSAGHGSWPALSPSTIAQRRQGSDRPLLDTGMLRASTQRGDGLAVFELSRARLVYGSAHPLAAVHQYGASFTVAPRNKPFLAWRGPNGWVFCYHPVHVTIPARPFIPDPPTHEQESRLRMIIQDYAAGVCRAATGAA
jgi:phage gpG-like protein